MYGLYDSGYTFNDIFTAKVNKTSNAKVYSGISHSKMLPYADEFIEVGFSLLDVYGGFKILNETTDIGKIVEPLKNNEGWINFYF